MNSQGNDVDKVDNEDILLNSVIRNINELRDCNCPPKILEMLEEWVFDMKLDRIKYIKWLQGCKK